MNLKNNEGGGQDMLIKSGWWCYLKHCISFKRNIEFTYINNGVVVLKQTILVKDCR